MGLLFTIVMTLAAAAGGDAGAGKQKSVTCGSCHGLQGVSPNDEWPNLAGQKRAYIVAQLHAFKDGARKNQLMTPMAASLSDTDIEDLAAYYAQLAPQPATPGK